MFLGQVALTWFSVCVVVAEDTEFVRSVFDKDHPPPFVYHRLDLRSPRNKCRHFNRVALRGRIFVTVSLVPNKRNRRLAGDEIEEG